MAQSTDDLGVQPPGEMNNHDTTEHISEDEVALYDRQIRLWGFQAQQRLREANILLVTIKALGNEVAKNLVLAGIGSLTVIDGAPVTEDDLGAQFLISEEDIGKPRAEAAAPSLRKLNPRVNITTYTCGALALADPNFQPPPEPQSPTGGSPAPQSQTPPPISSYTLILALDLPITTLNTLNSAARFSNVPFYAGASHGLYGFLFADLIAHDFSFERAAPNIPTVIGTAESPTRTVLASTLSEKDGKKFELVTKREVYQPLILTNSSPLPPSILHSPRRLRRTPPLLPCLRALFDFESSLFPAPRGPDLQNPNELMAFTGMAKTKREELQIPSEVLSGDFIKEFVRNVGVELAATCAVLGGQLAQDAVNVVGGREQPIQNMVLFDGEEGRGDVLALCPVVGV